MYSVKPKNVNRFRHDFERLTPMERKKVRNVLESLTQNPRPPGCSCLEKNYYRLRVGDIRILYHAQDSEKTISIGSIVRRGEKTYKDWKRYFK